MMYFSWTHRAIEWVIRRFAACEAPLLVGLSGSSGNISSIHNAPTSRQLYIRLLVGTGSLHKLATVPQEAVKLSTQPRSDPVFDHSGLYCSPWHRRKQGSTVQLDHDTFFEAETGSSIRQFPLFLTKINDAKRIRDQGQPDCVTVSKTVEPARVP